MSVRIVLADDHRIILEGLEQLFRRERDFQVLATCTNGEEALAAVHAARGARDGVITTMSPACARSRTRTTTASDVR